MHILVGSDHFGYNLKTAIKEHLLELGHEVVDLGCDDAQTPVNYPDVAVAVAERIASGACARGILICGTGIGMAIAANKVPGVRAACCHDP
ncbi:MAG TPA: RpiB/LacA/LacB family sugar-phosphate isomerase, partial [Ktedonobacteraceae bacterium]|nr:RpiB/LacA/LacB family sugar-phosphate isomerase [Ktedonobacteraceae bacterium]